jgi:protein SCO1/2
MASTDESGLARARKALWIGVAVAGLAGLGMWGYAQTQSAPPASDYASAFGGTFTLTDPAGKLVSDKTLAGKPYAIFFGFTRCPDVCPTSLARMASLRQQLGADGYKFNIVFVSVDPERDTKAELAQYLTLFDTPIIGASGTAAETAQAVKAFHVFYERVPNGPGDYTIDHTASIFLMDAGGRFVSTIAHNEAQETALAKLKRLVSQS